MSKQKKIGIAVVCVFTFITTVLLFFVSDTGCKCIQEYINGQVAPFIEQTKKIDKNVAHDIAYLRYSDDFKKLMEENFKDSLLINLQSFVAHTNSLFGRNYQAFKTFEYYHTYFSHLVPKEDALEIMYREMVLASSSGQYKTCVKLVQDFFNEYGSHPEDAGEWYNKFGYDLIFLHGNRGGYRNMDQVY